VPGDPSSRSELERRRRRRDSTLGTLEFRVLAFVAGAALLLGSVIAYHGAAAASRLWALTLLSVAAIVGAILVGMSLFWSDAAVRDAAERAGLSAAAGVLGALAFPFAWLVRKVRGR
jgi:uncharacterized membrane-anchored protein